MDFPRQEYMQPRCIEFDEAKMMQRARKFFTWSTNENSNELIDFGRSFGAIDESAKIKRIWRRMATAKYRFAVAGTVSHVSPFNFWN